ncbi:hypothetical protein ASPVEDRAFT_79106 [Aspergillus versicolor CBS 583.65]|uniref:Gfo/Idh/MocA-like oxidoreductase N-terminal domain-containing protein n=1 Tax=Aspergillus versicolor CBS 583.65 TaxID=1036611 RepID=A0A1L9P7G3_ASPVE|nr:uncharacterized protein ASPVEDRAFT_79106 [Aspergillus versicolor CBS 583.65]OJI97383.1 hypothetical protein ASPVEDRAFT_79106 [Aspergillus versicolor CBS 583.65]
MPEQLSIVIIGAGLIGPRHAQSVQAHPETNLVAFIDPSPSAQPIASSFNVPCHPSLDALLSNTSSPPDAAIICTPNHTHVPLALQLLKQKIHILLEKPVSDSLATAKSLLSTSSQHPDVKILVGHHRRFNPYIQSTKALLAANSLGSIIAVNGLWTLLKPDSYFAPPLGSWRADREKGGVLGINLIHDIDVLQFLFGPVRRVFAEGTKPQREQTNPEHTAEEGCAVTLRFASGVVGTFLVSDVVPSPLNFETGTRENPTIPGVEREESASDCYRIFGRGGSLSVPDMTRWSYDGVDGNSSAEKGWNSGLSVERMPVDGVDVKPFDRQLEHFVRVLRGEEEVSCSVEDGVRALRVVGGVREAMESGKPVDIADK